jgi:hypothetical protein
MKSRYLQNKTRQLALNDAVERLTNIRKSRI